MICPVYPLSFQLLIFYLLDLIVILTCIIIYFSSKLMGFLQLYNFLMYFVVVVVVVIVVVVVVYKLYLINVMQ